jgi:hypothetical protein
MSHNKNSRKNAEGSEKNELIHRIEITRKDIKIIR